MPLLTMIRLNRTLFFFRSHEEALQRAFKKINIPGVGIAGEDDLLGIWRPAAIVGVPLAFAMRNPDWWTGRPRQSTGGRWPLEWQDMYTHVEVAKRANITNRRPIGCNG